MSVDRLAEWFYDELPPCTLTESIQSSSGGASTENENQQKCSRCALRRRLIQAIPTVNDAYKRSDGRIADMMPNPGHLPLLWQIGFVKWGASSPSLPQEASAFMDDVSAEMVCAFAGQRDGVAGVAEWWALLMDTMDVVGLEVAFGSYEGEDAKDSPLAVTLLLGAKTNPPGIEISLDEKKLFPLSRWVVAVQCSSAGHLPSCESHRPLEAVETDSALQVLFDLVNILSAILLRVPALRMDALAQSSKPDASETRKRSLDIEDSVVVGHAVRGFLTAACRLRLHTVAEGKVSHGSNEIMAMRSAVSAMLQQRGSVENTLHAAVTLIEATLEVAWESPSQSNFLAYICDSMLRAVADEWMLLLPRNGDALDWLTRLFRCTAQRLQARWPHTSPLERPVALCFLRSGAGLVPAPGGGGSSHRRCVAVVCSALLNSAVRCGNAFEGAEALLRAALRGHRTEIDEETFLTESMERCAARARGGAKACDEALYFGVVLDAVAEWRARVGELMCEEEENEKKEKMERRRYEFFEGWLNAMREMQRGDAEV